jgi:AcrR family transcriptional regulator
VTTGPDLADQERLLRNALEAFLTHGFHAIPLEALEAATGLTWGEVVAAFGDKEGLFLAAAEHGLRSGSVAAAGKTAEVEAMIARLERANGNPRLRAIHKRSLTTMRSIAEQGPDAG